MPTATLPRMWRGRSGREYVPAGKARLRHGGLASVRKVVGRGGPAGTSILDDGSPMALKLWREGDEDSLDQLQREARVLVELSATGGELPAPRLYDLVGDPLVTGMVLEWCPMDLERWWRDKLKEPDAFGRLMAAMSEISRRVAEVHRLVPGRAGLDVAHGDLKPTNVLMSMEGRWLVSDFGTRLVGPPEDEVWADSRLVIADENFLAPEILFQARTRYPAAADAWSLGASLFALLKLKRMADEDAAIPRNGTQSPRFRMERVSRVFEVYGRDPRRFVDADLDPAAFPDPLAIPEEDRRTVRESLRGVFGSAAPELEEQERELAEKLLELLDRALSIDPAHRYTDCRDLAAAFEGLTRTYIALSATAETTGTAAPDIEALASTIESARERNRSLAARVAQLESELAMLQSATPAPAPRASRTPRPPLWFGVALVLLLGMHAVTLLLVALTLAMQSGAL